MKNFGAKSVSSVFSVVLKVMWYVVLVGSICGAMFYTAVISSERVQTFIADSITKQQLEHPTEEGRHDIEGWKQFNQAPLALKMLAFPYAAAVVVLGLMIMKKSTVLFDNFRKDIVFNNSNVSIISGINKLMIPFSIITFNFSGLLTCVLLYMLGEIFKNGTALQEEHDLTV